MAKALKKGDVVSWKSHGGTAYGTIVKKVTRPARIKCHRAAAAPDNPEFVVGTEEGKRAAHRPGALSRE